MRNILNFFAAAFVAAAVAGACTPASVQDTSPEPGRDGMAILPEGVAASLQAETAGDSVRLTLRITNASRDAIPLTFPTGQSYDFVIRRDGREVWRWSEGMMFTQAIRQETLAPDETRTYTASWSHPADSRGAFSAEGWLTAQEHQFRQSTVFHLP